MKLPRCIGMCSAWQSVWPVHVEERGRAVAPLLDVGGVARPHEGLAHLLDDRGEGAADDLDRDRIDLDRVRRRNGSRS